jgi:hypothetical protein
VKFRCLLGDQFMEVDATDRDDAQNQAFAKFVARLSPSDFIVWETGPQDEWREESP